MPAIHPSHDDAAQKPKGAVDEDNARLVPILLSIAKSTRGLTGLKLNELGFHNGQDELLLALDDKARDTVSELADKLNIRPSTVSKMLDRLIEHGMLERVPDERDARRTLARLTPAGKTAQVQLLALRKALEDELIASFAKLGGGTLEALETVASTLTGRLRRLR